MFVPEKPMKIGIGDEVYFNGRPARAWISDKTVKVTKIIDESETKDGTGFYRVAVEFYADEVEILTGEMSSNMQVEYADESRDRIVRGDLTPDEYFDR